MCVCVCVCVRAALALYTRNARKASKSTAPTVCTTLSQVGIYFIRRPTHIHLGFEVLPNTPHHLRLPSDKHHSHPTQYCRLFLKQLYNTLDNYPSKALFNDSEFGHQNSGTNSWCLTVPNKTLQKFSPSEYDLKI